MNQTTRNADRRVMYIENKDGHINGFDACIGWVTFSKTGLSIYYKGRRFRRLKGGDIFANYYCEESGDQYWISGIKKRGSNVHWAESASVHIDTDAADEYHHIKNT